MVGTMIEIPRGALTADEIAQSAEFFSFGTNDLTQTGLGMSRDDSGSFLPQYQELEIVKKNPFATIDATGVGQLVADRGDEGPRHAPEPEARHLRRARRRSGVDPLLREGRAGLRELLAVPRAGRAPRGGAGGARRSRSGIDYRPQTRRRVHRLRRSGGPRLAQARQRRLGVGRSRQRHADEARILSDRLPLPRARHRRRAERGRTIPRSSPTATISISSCTASTSAPPSTASRRQDIDFFLGPQYLVTVHHGRRRGRSAGSAQVCGRDNRVLGEGPGVLHVPHHRHDGRQLPAGGGEARGAARRDRDRGLRERPTRTSRGGFSTSRRTSPSLRQVVLPQRDAVGRLARREFPLINEPLAYRFRDVHDHLVRLSDEAMFFQDRITQHSRRAPLGGVEPVERRDEGADHHRDDVHAADRAHRACTA